MKTVQIVLDESTLRAADGAAKRLNMNRSALFREALRHYLAHRARLELERKHRAGYERHPVAKGEFDAWDEVLAWSE